jgi:hypothetical protein
MMGIDGCEQSQARSQVICPNGQECSVREGKGVTRVTGVDLHCRVPLGPSFG